MIRYTVLGPFFTLLPCLYELRSTDNKIRTIKKVENLCNIPMFSRK